MGLPDGIRACVFDLDGVLTQTAKVHAAAKLGTAPDRCAVFADALAGVEAGRTGRIGFVVGVDRVSQTQALKAHDAEIVVNDLAELLDDL